MEFGVDVRLYAPGVEESVLYATTFRGLPPDPHVDLVFDRGPPVVTKMRIEIKNLNAGETANVHVREISLR